MQSLNLPYSIFLLGMALISTPQHMRLQPSAHPSYARFSDFTSVLETRFIRATSKNVRFQRSRFNLKYFSIEEQKLTTKPALVLTPEHISGLVPKRK